ncbi:MAG: ferritin family protein, partial [Chitinivibrionales bacterium]
MTDMGLIYNADEIFKMGIRIEENGRDFYKEASERFSSNEVIRNLFNDLSEWESGHVELFTRLRSELSEKEGHGIEFDP